jgi:hypothetical protein
MKKGISFLVAAACFVNIPSLTHGQEPPPRKKPQQTLGPMEEKLFSDMDTNADGVLSKVEFEAFHARRFKEIDTNVDSRITRDELQAQFKKMVERSRESFREHFNNADGNQDGSLSREEAKKIPMLAKHFDEVDSNKNNKVTADEMAAVMKKMHQSTGAGK